MPQLSPAVHGQKRGLLEVLKYPPSIGTSLHVNPIGKHADAIEVYSFIVFVPSLIVAVSLGGYLAIGLSTLFGILYVLTAIGKHLESPKEKVLEGLREAAYDAVSNANQVDVSSYIDNSLFSENNYVDNLNPKQQRWVMKKWNEEIDFAKKKFTSPSSTFAGQLDSMVSDEKMRRVSYHKKAIEELSRKEGR